jgi:hypothetical protein
MPEPGFRSTDEKLYITDTLPAFTLPSCFPSGCAINWSKTFFSLLERNGRLSLTTCEKIIRRFQRFCDIAAGLGFNAVSIDDLAHFAAFDGYPGRLREKIGDYADLFLRLCCIAGQAGLKVFVTTDADYSTICGSGREAAPSLAEACNILFSQFQTAAGVILRIGECDGLDIDHEMRSRLFVRTPAQAHSLVSRLLPLFEQLRRTLIVRTWTIGAFRVGDLIWNSATYRAVFDGITSSALIVSHKYGDTDFFRYLSLNPLVFQGTQRKLVEFQARREYEGFGEFPSFIGDDCEKFRDELTQCASFAGIQVWCQTGGWSKFRSATFMPGSSVYNEVNTAVIVSLFVNNSGVEDAVARFCRFRQPQLDPVWFLRLLRLSAQVMEDLWYMPEFSRRTVYFRRTRVPPLLWVFWDTIVISETLRQFICLFARSDVGADERSCAAFAKINEMELLADKMRLDRRPFILLRRTLEIIALAREYFFYEPDRELVRRITNAVERYKRDFPREKRFSVVCDFSSRSFEQGLLRIILPALVRTTPSYRFVDRVFFTHIAKVLIPFLKIWNRHRLPAFVRERGMGFESLFR